MRPLIVLIMSSAFLLACHGQQATDIHPISNFASGVSGTETQRHPWTAYAAIDRLLTDPRIVEKSWNEIQRAFPEECQQMPDTTEIACPPMLGVTRISVIASGHGIVDILMAAPVTCEEIRAVVVQRFGPAKTTSTNGCSGDWDLSKYMKTGYLRISRGKKDPTKVSLQFGVEQGP
jgi:hypothetical protein